MSNLKLLVQIQSDLIDIDKSLAGALLKTKVLANQIDNNPLFNWVNFELNGYKEVNDLPSYRVSSGDFIGNITNGRAQITDYAISLTHIPNDISDTIKEVKILDSVASIEQLLNSKGALVISVPDKTKRYIESSYMKLGNPYFQILSIYQRVSPTLFTGILTSVRSKLLDFILELITKFGLEPEINDLKANNSTITTIMQTTINNNGDGAVINTGDNSNIKAKIQIHKADKTHLSDALQNNKVDIEDINSLIEIIDIDTTDQVDKYSAPVSEWMKKMLNKAIDGSWQVGIGAAGSILADALAKYYGWK